MPYSILQHYLFFVRFIILGSSVMLRSFNLPLVTCIQTYLIAHSLFLLSGNVILPRALSSHVLLCLPWLFHFSFPPPTRVLVFLYNSKSHPFAVSFVHVASSVIGTPTLKYSTCQIRRARLPVLGELDYQKSFRGWRDANCKGK